METILTERQKAEITRRVARVGARRTEAFDRDDLTAWSALARRGEKLRAVLWWALMGSPVIDLSYDSKPIRIPARA